MISFLLYTLFVLTTLHTLGSVALACKDKRSAADRFFAILGGTFYGIVAYLTGVTLWG